MNLYAIYSIYSHLRKTTVEFDLNVPVLPTRAKQAARRVRQCAGQGFWNAAPGSYGAV